MQGMDDDGIWSGGFSKSVHSDRGSDGLMVDGLMVSWSLVFGRFTVAKHNDLNIFWKILCAASVKGAK
jgi:hypothetical protein